MASKGLRGDVADEIFSLQRLDRFSFDVEIVYLALKHKLDIKRIPVQLRNNETSSVRLARDAAQGFVDVFRIKWYQLRGAYASPALARSVHDDFDRVREGARLHTGVARVAPRTPSPPARAAGE